MHFWLHSGAELNRGTEHHADWTPLAWAKWSKPGSDIINLVTPACASEAGAEHNVLDVGHLVGKRSRSPLRGAWADVPSAEPCSSPVYHPAGVWAMPPPPPPLPLSSVSEAEEKAELLCLD